MTSKMTSIYSLSLNAARRKGANVCIMMMLKTKIHPTRKSQVCSYVLSTVSLTTSLGAGRRFVLFLDARVYYSWSDLF